MSLLSFTSFMCSGLFREREFEISVRVLCVAVAVRPITGALVKDLHSESLL